MKTELLAPAGSMEALKAAVSAGADAVYLGGAAFGARAYAKNLDEQEILSAIDYVHLRNRKLYLTVNTLLKEEELEEKLYPYLRPYYEQGLDAVIVQDMGVLKAVRSWFPDLDIHASTQMTVTGSAGARFLESLGATRLKPLALLGKIDQTGQRGVHLDITHEIDAALGRARSARLENIKARQFGERHDEIALLLDERALGDSLLIVIREAQGHGKLLAWANAIGSTRGAH